MVVLGSIFSLVAGLVLAVASIWLLVEAFKVHILWGLGSIFVPFVSIVFVVMHWGKAKKPFLISLAAGVVMAIAMVPAMMEMQSKTASLQAEMERQAAEAPVAADTAP